MNADPPGNPASSPDPSFTRRDRGTSAAGGTPDDPHAQLQRLVDGLLELNSVLQMAHDRLEELRDLARFAGHQDGCVNLVMRLDDLREGVNQLKQTLEAKKEGNS